MLSRTTKSVFEPGDPVDRSFLFFRGRRDEGVEAGEDAIFSINGIHSSQLELPGVGIGEVVVLLLLLKFGGSAAWCGIIYFTAPYTNTVPDDNTNTLIYINFSTKYKQQQKIEIFKI